MRYTKFIALLATMLVSVACFQDDLDFGGERIDTESDIITIYGNVARFADCEVSTRANKTPEESYVSSMALAVFPIINDDGTIGNCIHYELRDGSNLLYTLDRAKIREKYGTDYDDADCVMYIFANMPDLPSNGYEGSLDYLLNLALPTPGLTRPEAGFPMIGSLGDKNRDGNEFELIPMTGNRMDLPKVNESPTDYLNIPMSAIFAKISFEITVSPDQDVDVHAPARFEMTGYEIHNLPLEVSFNSVNNTEAKQPVNTDSKKNPVVAISGIAQGGDEGSGSKIEFDFYLPERLLTPSKALDNVLPTELKKGTYDTDVDADQNGYRDKDERYHQRYKPLLLGENQEATYVTIKGKYRDHHEEYYEVEYDIYLGADNYGDFNIVRNNQYYNKLNIKGITSSNDQSLDQGAISIDHRVNVEHSSPLIVSIRRETQLDAHFEVRPMRMRISDDVPGATAVVEVIYDTEPTHKWVGLERSFGDGVVQSSSPTYLVATDLDDDSKNSLGKRKYFTTNLLDELSDKVTVDNLSNSQNTTVWIYVDEATDVNNATTSRSTRSATIRVTYTDDSGNNDVKDYTITQYNLHKITGAVSNSDYYIECYEEYLYNYDSEDSYGQIREEGLPWGLDELQLSKDHKSFNPNIAGEDWQSTYTDKYSLPVYDFYVSHDSFVEKQGGTMRKFNGQTFTDEIAKTTKNKGNGVKHLTMAQQADGAVEYCYNRNKRNSDGSIAKVEWYLPSADELEDFIVPAYNYYKEFQDNFYWTSQPAYIRNIFYYERNYIEWFQPKQEIYAFTIYEDNVDYARATKIIQNNNGELEPVPSGLNSIAYKSDGTQIDNRSSNSKTDYEILTPGYYYMMRHYKKPSIGSASVTDNFTGVPNGQDVSNAYNYDSWYTETSTDKKYYVHLGHLYNLMQEGYRPRTEPHRVRCAYKKAN